MTSKSGIRSNLAGDTRVFRDADPNDRSTRRRRAGSPRFTGFPFESSVGGLAWAFGPPDDFGRAEGWVHRLWYDDDRVVAWGRIYPPEMIRVTPDREELAPPTLVFATRDDVPTDVFDALLGWFNEAGDGEGRV